MAPPPSTAVPPVVSLTVRIITFLFILISVIVMATNKISAIGVEFSDFYAYRYMLASGVIGMAYTLGQAAFTLYYMSTGNKIGGDGSSTVDFFADKVVSYLLATGAAACFGFTVDLKHVNDMIVEDSDTGKFLNKEIAAAAILLVGFIFSAMSSIISCLSLPKRDSGFSFSQLNHLVM